MGIDLNKVIISTLAMIIAGILAISVVGCDTVREEADIGAVVIVDKVGTCAHGKKFPPTSAVKSKENIEFVVTIANNSKVELIDVSIRDAISPGMTLVSGELDHKFDSIKPGERSSYKYTVNTGPPLTHILKGPRAQFDAGGRNFTSEGQEIYIDVQLTTSC